MDLKDQGTVWVARTSVESNLPLKAQGTVFEAMKRDKAWGRDPIVAVVRPNSQSAVRDMEESLMPTITEESRLHL
jgi:hypothetical protein